MTFWEYVDLGRRQMRDKRIADLEAALREAVAWIEQDGCAQSDRDVAASLRKLLEQK